MKKLLYIVSAGLILFSSCSKDLDQQPLSTTTSETFFESQEDFVLALNGVYGVAMRGNTIGNSYGYPDRLMNLSETRSDNLYAITDGARTWEGINGFQTSIANNQYVTEAWVNNYDAIAKANLLLEKLVEKSAVFYDDSVKNTIEGQARFLRAFCYFDLVRWFGPVPLVTKTLTVDESKTIGRSAVTDVYAQILSDLEFAEGHSPTTALGAATGPGGRVTTWAVKTLKALVHMTRSSPTYGINGPGLGLNEWGTAYNLLNEVATGSGATYDADYASIFKNENTKEIIWDVNYITGNDGVGASFVWVCTSDEYFRSIGLSAQGANYRRPVSNSFRAEFDAADKRLAASMIDSFAYSGVTYVYPMYIKYVDKSRYGTGRTNWGVNFIVFRYTDVMMMKAECALHGGGGSAAEADEVVNYVRTRAGLEATATGTTLDELFAERRKEFNAEGTRWFDLQRSGKLVEWMNAFREADDLSDRISPINVNSVLYPVPQGQINIAPGLYTQNPGYD